MIVYLPTWLIYMGNVGQYTIVPWNDMGNFTLSHVLGWWLGRPIEKKTIKLDHFPKADH